ncbi:MAG: class I SAM-dependent methyltransferase [Anaerolineales bacterium]|nr:class I SAM-dependent methyltransferase [Anaerolineales bacterium]
MRADQDAYGQEVYDFYRGEKVVEIVERDDKYIDASGGPAAYFAPFAQWPVIEQEAIQLAEGRVLDVGCGPGRVALYLQEKGHEVVGIDNSPLAVKTARLRGVADARVLSITRVSRKVLGLFDTIVMFGNNFGLFGSFRRAKWLLRRFYRMTGDNGRILAESRNIYETDNPAHLAFHERNRQRGRMSGQVRIRVRYQTIIGPWFDYLMVSPDEMRQIVADTGWHVAQIIRGDEGGMYTAVLEKAL